MIFLEGGSEENHRRHSKSEAQKWQQRPYKAQQQQRDDGEEDALAVADLAARQPQLGDLRQAVHQQPRAPESQKGVQGYHHVKGGVQRVLLGIHGEMKKRGRTEWMLSEFVLSLFWFFSLCFLVLSLFSSKNMLIRKIIARIFSVRTSRN